MGKLRQNYVKTKNICIAINTLELKEWKYLNIYGTQRISFYNIWAESNKIHENKNDREKHNQLYAYYMCVKHVIYII